MRRTGWRLVLIFVVMALAGCTSNQERAGQVEMTAQPTPTPTLSPEEREAALLEEPGVVEAITVGDAQVVLRQGEKKGSVEFVSYDQGEEKVLAALPKGRLEISKSHIEPFQGEILGYEGFYLFERDANFPFSYVYYIGLKGDRAKILLINNAVYREKKKRFKTVFDEVWDIDGDGIREVISNNLYVADGGNEAVIYDCDEKGRILEGYLEDLFDDECYIGRATDLKVGYQSKKRKVWMEFYPSRAAAEAGRWVTKKCKLNKKSLEKIKMEKIYFYTKSSQLKDLRNYD